MGFDVGKLQRKGQDTLRKINEQAEILVKNTEEDIYKILSEVSDCAESIEQIRIHIMHRALQYHTSITQALIDAELIPVEIVEKVIERISGKIPPHAPPKLYRLNNPYRAVWKKEVEQMQEVDIDEVEISLENPPYLFVHGMSYPALSHSAFQFYKAFELEARMVKDPDHPISNAHIYIVSYDTDLTKDTELLITKELAAVVGDTVTGVGDAQLIYFAVLWKELVDRAKEAGCMLYPFLKKILLADASTPKLGRAISHSLGTYVIAQAAKVLIEDVNIPNPSIFKEWWCMNSAMTADAFTNTSTPNYTETPRIAGSMSDPGTVIWFSRTDLVLSYLYPLANKGSFAVGMTGALKHIHPLINLDVTMCSHLTHREDDGYFNLLGHTIRTRLGTASPSKNPCELRWPDNIDLDPI